MSSGIRSFDTRDKGLLVKLFHPSDVPGELLKCEELRAGDRILVDKDGEEIVLAGTVRARPYGFLPFQCLVETEISTRRNTSVKIDVPLHYYYLPANQRYEQRITGGYNSRMWYSVGTFSVGDPNPGVSITVGSENLQSRKLHVAEHLKSVIDMILALPPDMHAALDSVNTVHFTPESIN